jgi:sigma-B regulation protein RsbU (phosphoserine phosphatase)
VLGIFPDVRYPEGATSLAPGDKLLLFTDGITEACDERGEELGEVGLLDLLRANSHLRAADLKNALLAAVSNFRTSDDATLVVVSSFDPGFLG